VTDPGTPATPGGVVNPGERLIIISGHPTNLNMAVGMLHAVSRRDLAPYRTSSLRRRWSWLTWSGLFIDSVWICSDSNRKRQRSWKAPGAEVEDTKQSTDAKSRVSARTNVWLAGGVFFLYHTYVSCTSVLPPWLGH
jgi:hypothetical protein